MQTTFEDAVKSRAIAMATNEGGDPHETILIHPADTRTPEEMASHGAFQSRSPEAIEDNISVPRWMQYRYRAAMELLGQPDGDYLALLRRKLATAA